MKQRRRAGGAFEDRELPCPCRVLPGCPVGSRIRGSHRRLSRGELPSAFSITSPKPASNLGAAEFARDYPYRALARALFWASAGQWAALPRGARTLVVPAHLRAAWPEWAPIGSSVAACALHASAKLMAVWTLLVAQARRDQTGAMGGGGGPNRGGGRGGGGSMYSGRNATRMSAAPRCVGKGSNGGAHCRAGGKSERASKRPHPFPRPVLRDPSCSAVPRVRGCVDRS